MSKRRCPFDTCLMKQSKQHVGEKDYAERDNDRMKQIYEKTIALMFKNTKNVGNPRALRDITAAHSETNGDGSKLILQDDMEYCTLCNDLNTVVNSCEFCDKWMCIQCGVPCANCCNVFCKYCSIKLYAGEQDEGVCLTCCTELA